MLAGQEMVLAAEFAPALATLSTSCLCCWTTRAKEMEPPAGAAPARFLYKRNPQAAAWRRKWSQSPVLPWAERAYETRLSAGSTAFLADDHQIKMEPPPGIAPRWLPYQRSASLKMLWGRKIGVPDRLRSGDLLHERQACWLDYTTGTEMVRVSGNAPEPGTDLVRCGV